MNRAPSEVRNTEEEQTMKSKHVGGLLLSEQFKVYFSKLNMMYPCPAVLSIQTNSIAGSEQKQSVQVTPNPAHTHSGNGAWY